MLELLSLRGLWKVDECILHYEMAMSLRKPGVNVLVKSDVFGCQVTAHDRVTSEALLWERRLSGAV